MFEFGNIYIEGKETGRIGTGDIICLKPWQLPGLF